MLRPLSLAALLLLGGCGGHVAAWEKEPTGGIYPYRVASLNGPPTYFIGWKKEF